tara:strand:+ start:3011 stop:4309 length:1299 start_codon:yes stop_codon:yes gene_type:complete
VYSILRILLIGLFAVQSLQGDDTTTAQDPKGEESSTAVSGESPASKEKSSAPAGETAVPAGKGAASAAESTASADEASGSSADTEDSATLDSTATPADSSEVSGAEPSDLSPVITTDQTWIDESHSWLYNESQEMIEWFDGLFAPDGTDPLKTPPSRFRLGLFAEFNLDEDKDFKLSPVIDIKTDIHLPNLERRLKLFISTRDPTALPDENIADANNELRVGATRDFFKNWNTSIGVKARWPPEAFANVEWAPTYKLPRMWTLYPKVKPFWDSEKGFGGMGSMIADKWSKRWLFRQVVSGKWDQKSYDDDKNDANDPDNYQYGQDGEGYRWSLSSVIGFVPALLDERDYGRRVGGADVADGWGLRGRIDGNLAQTLQYDLTLFRKGPLYKDFVFYVIAPEVSWERSANWKAEYSVQIGFEVLLWGDRTIIRR